MLSLFPVISALLEGAGGAAMTALGSISTAQWIGIAFEALRAAPEVRAALGALHPAFNAMVQAIEQNMHKAPDDAAEAGQIAAQEYLDSGPHYHGGPRG